MSTLINSIDHAATTLSSGIDSRSEAVALALPQALRFNTALAAAQEKHTSSAQAFARFYRDAGVSLTTLRQSLGESEDAASLAIRQLNGVLR